MEYSQEVISNNIRFLISRRPPQRVQANGRCHISGIDHNNIVTSLRRNSAQNIFDQITFGVNHNDPVSSHNVLAGEVKQQRAFANTSRAEDMEVVKRVFDVQTE